MVNTLRTKEKPLLCTPEDFMAIRMLSKDGDIAEHMMYNTFNMGVGMIIGVAPVDVEAFLLLLITPTICVFVMVPSAIPSIIA